MKFKLENKLTETSLKKLDGVLLPVWVREKKPDVMGEVFALFPKAEQKFIKEYLTKKDRKPGKNYILQIKGDPGFVFVAIEKNWDEKSLTLLIRKFIRTAKAEGLKKIGFYVDDFEKDNIASAKAMQLVSENSLLAQYDFSERFKAKPQDGWPKVDLVTLFTHHKNRAVENSLHKGEVLGEAVNKCRDLSNYPPGDMSPEAMARAAKEAAKGVAGLTVQIFDEKRLKKEKMNAILAVGDGSARKPRLIIMEYKGGKEKEASLALVGKGITFDSGGLNLKPSNGMHDMHMDMSGGSAVIYAMSVIGKLKLPINVTAYIVAAENMISGDSYRPRDIIKAYGGKTIEIGNTDSEGRVVMADAIEYAKTKKQALIVTLATLTGASVIALGERFAGLFIESNHELRDVFEKIGKDTGDFIWPLPLTGDNQKHVEGNFADVINTSKDGKRWGGASSAAAFLSHFAKGVPFVHIDMAPTMTTLPEEQFLSKGATGFGVRYFVELASRWDEVKELVKE